MTPFIRRTARIAVLIVLGGCGSGGFGATQDSGPGFWGRSDAGTMGPLPPVDAGPPPEVEERRSFQTPQAGGRFVYVANPTRNTVAVIDSRTLEIDTVEVGDRPTYLLTVPGGTDAAIVLNVLSDTASILRTDATATRVSNVPVAHGMNAIAIAPDARHAIVYLDTDAPGASLMSGSFQDISLLTLEDGMDRAVQLSVGFRPTEVVFAADGSAAFVITEDGISILRFADITGPTIIPGVSLGDRDVVVSELDAGPPDLGPADAGSEPDAELPDAEILDGALVDATPSDAGTRDAGSPDAGLIPGFDGVARDVTVTADGKFAVARVEGSRILRLVDLERRTIQLLDAGGAVTDVDVSPDSQFAIAVLREQSRVLRLPLPGAWTAPSSIGRIDLRGETVGSVAISPDGRRALLYTTAYPVERITILDLTGAEPAIALRLRKAVRAVVFAPDGRSALIVNTREPGDPRTTDLEAQIDRSFGYTLVDPALRFAKLQLTTADIGPLAIMPDGATSYVLLRDDAAGISQVQSISMRSFSVTTIALGSPPTSIGAVPTTRRAFIGQDHPEGRITFVDWSTSALQSVTGFELNSRIVR